MLGNAAVEANQTAKVRTWQSRIRRTDLVRARVFGSVACLSVIHILKSFDGGLAPGLFAFREGAETFVHKLVSVWERRMPFRRAIVCYQPLLRPIQASHWRIAAILTQCDFRHLLHRAASFCHQ